MTVRFSLLLCLLAALMPLAASASSPPPGATARCRDGTYNFSKHRSGACSHHGGVAAWLGAGSSAPVRLAVGRTVLLGPRTRSVGCRLAALPDRRCSPGGFYSRLTRAVLCDRSFHTSAVRNVPQSEKFAVEREYGLTPSTMAGRSRSTTSSRSSSAARTRSRTSSPSARPHGRGTTSRTASRTSCTSWCAPGR